MRQLKHWLKEATRARKLKVEMETAGIQTKHCSGKDVETQTNFLVVCPKETQTDPCLIEETEMKTEDPCVFSQETQMDHPTVDIAIQIDAEEDIRIDFILQEAAEATVQIDHMNSQDGEVQIDETPSYTPLVREAIIRWLQNELLMVQRELAHHKEKVVLLHEHQGLRKKFEALTMTEYETFAQYKAEKNKVERLKGKLQKARGQMEIVFSLYSNTLSCRAPTSNYALFLMERYLLLKFKAAKAGK